MKHVQTVDQTLNLEIFFAGDISAAGLSDAVNEALEKGGVIDAGGIVCIKASAPGERLAAVDVWVPEEVEAEEPPTIPEDTGTPEPNV
ncbi:hypothetical protein LCGC14_0288670 [marine sediment metagenome]|uniref:Uncharacterized protein n=1 Tax=marine sediment metagenome TaxID=412755 RepID=A0A0F9TTP7_9ZZZZ